MRYGVNFSTLHSTVTMENPLNDFGRMLQYYTPKALTNPSDILRALAGVVRRITETAKCRFLEGLPTAAFDAFIVFEANGWILRRREGFPSYSWTGWKGGVTVETSATRPLNVRLEEDTWIIWYKRSPAGALSLVWDPSRYKPCPIADPTFEGYRQRRPFQSRQLHLLSIQEFPTVATEKLPYELPAIRYHLLQFWTLSVRFKLKTEDAFRGSASIVTRSGARVGTIYLDGTEESAFFDSQEPFEFILLSISWRPHPDGQKYVIMLLEWNGPIAERRGLGFIDQPSIVQGFLPGPQWKEIVLG
jgi:hypothetical protein